jgi:hypothetical protein
LCLSLSTPGSYLYIYARWTNTDWLPEAREQYKEALLTDPLTDAAKVVIQANCNTDRPKWIHGLPTSTTGKLDRVLAMLGRLDERVEGGFAELTELTKRVALLEGRGRN